MKVLLATSVASLLGATVAFAGSTNPSDVMFGDGAVKASLTGVAGGGVAGRAVFANRKLGNCLVCHVNSEMPEHSFHGEVGPPIDGAGDRWGVAELCGIISNSKMTFEDTIMPAFYIDSGYFRLLDEFTGVSILTAQQVEDVAAYVLTLQD